MLCNLFYETPIYSIEKVSRKETISYIFIGKVKKEVREILDLFEKKKSITKDKLSILKKEYPNDLKSWIETVKSKTKMKFLEERIWTDDSIQEIRQKIFIYLSDPSNNKYILPENQELWIQSDKTTDVIGYYYQSSITEERIPILPHLIDELRNNNTVPNNILQTDIKVNTSTNTMLIKDLLNELKYDSNKIYLSDALEEKEYMESKKQMNQFYAKTYFKKYWPYVVLNPSKSDVKTRYALMKEYYDRESYIHNLIDNPKTNHSSLIGGCNIITVLFNINGKRQISSFNSNSENNLSNNSPSEMINLYQVFDYLRINKIGLSMPFIKYNDESFDTPFSIISKEAIDHKKVDKKELKDWIGIKDEQKKITGLVMKRLIKEYENEPRYSSVSLKKDGNIRITVSFPNRLNASFDDVILSIKDCKKNIEDINLYLKTIDEGNTFQPPDMTMEDGNKIVLKENTKINYMNISIPVLTENINFSKLEEFARNFPSFITVSKKVNEKEGKSLHLKYIRVSGFSNMNEVLEYIEYLFLNLTEIDKDTIIIRSLQKKFNQTEEQAKSYLLEYKKKFSSQKSKMIDTKSKKGISIVISENSIQCTGLTKIYQIPKIHQFFSLFINLFMNQNKSMENKNFKRFFRSNLNRFQNVREANYEVDENAIINLNKSSSGINLFNIENILNTSIPSNQVVDDIEKQIAEESTEHLEKTNFANYYNNVKGLSRTGNIKAEIRMSCKDQVVEANVCKDSCEDPRYTLRRLQLFDYKLFGYEGDKKTDQETYSRKCQRASQPIVLPYDPEKNPKIKSFSYSYSIKYSSTPEEFQRWYICPKVWCPICQIPIDEKDVDPKTISKKKLDMGKGLCYTAKCPYGDHQIMIKVDDKALYPGFCDKPHPDGYCLPCCFSSSRLNPKSKFYPYFKKCLGEELEEPVSVKEGQIYILGKGIPIDKDRYGKLPYEIARILNTKIETGYLMAQKGYIRKGVLQVTNNSFLSSIADIISCDQKNISMNVQKLKTNLMAKLDKKLFRSLHYGNLYVMFDDNVHDPIENFGKYLNNPSTEVDHKYLWDLLQRPNIIFDQGVNIFIFDKMEEKTVLLCPFGENIPYFYDRQKKSILLIKTKEYYEPIYYLQGDGKSAKKTCYFDSEKQEIAKLFDICKENCNPSFDIQWNKVLKDNVEKFGIKVDNESYDLGESLQESLNKILSSIKDNNLSKSFIPDFQYVDSYNKVFSLSLKNGLIVPVSPSQIVEDLPIRSVNCLGDLKKQSSTLTLKQAQDLKKATKLSIGITNKILDLKEKKYVIAFVTEKNRIIPVEKSSNKFTQLPESSFQYYQDVDDALKTGIKLVDRRVDKINKKSYEDETYTRLRFEIAKFIRLKENKHFYDKIMRIIHSDLDQLEGRKQMKDLLTTLFKDIAIFGKKHIDFDSYETPNRRIPCFLQKLNAKNKSNNQLKLKNKFKTKQKKNQSNEEVVFHCEDDPHCIVTKDSCKVFVNDKNLLDIHYGMENYGFYLSLLTDELLRYKMKRQEILQDLIPSIINKENVKPNPSKYFIVHTNNIDQINESVEKMFMQEIGVKIDNRPFFEESVSREYAFPREAYLKFNSNVIEKMKLEDLALYWEDLLGERFKVIKREDNIMDIMSFVLRFEDENLGQNRYIKIHEIKQLIQKYLTESLKNNSYIEKLFKNFEFKGKHDEEGLISLYKQESPKQMKNVTNLNGLFSVISNDNYKGCPVDLFILSYMIPYNFIIIDRRIKKGTKGSEYLKNPMNDKVIILYRSHIIDDIVYHLVEQKNKFVFEENELSKEFMEKIKE